jgi:hypothetical protein
VDDHIPDRHRRFIARQRFVAAGCATPSSLAPRRIDSCCSSTGAGTDGRHHHRDLKVSEGQGDISQLRGRHARLCAPVTRSVHSSRSSPWSARRHQSCLISSAGNTMGSRDRPSSLFAAVRPPVSASAAFPRRISIGSATQSGAIAAARGAAICPPTARCPALERLVQQSRSPSRVISSTKTPTVC